MNSSAGVEDGERIGSLLCVMVGEGVDLFGGFDEGALVGSFDESGRTKTSRVLTSN